MIPRLIRLYMKRLSLFLIFAFLCAAASAQSPGTAQVHDTQLPVLTTQPDNILFKIRLGAAEGDRLDGVSLVFDEGSDVGAIRSLKLFYGGISSFSRSKPDKFEPVKYLDWRSLHRGDPAFPSYSRLISEIKGRFETGAEIRLPGPYSLYEGVNYLWVSVKLKKNASLDSKFSGSITEVSLSGRPVPVELDGTGKKMHRTGYGVKYHGENGSKHFRIPGIATTDKGTLVAVYDRRYNRLDDLQEHIDVGCSRSTDGGHTWKDAQPALDFSGHDNLPSAQNGVGDPAILFDPATKTLWVIAIRIHGERLGADEFASYSGQTPKGSYYRMVMAKSTDDGKTWSRPIDVTSSIADPSWTLMCQSPGSGIAMRDGTLVFGARYWDHSYQAHPVLVYSKDHGATWHCSKTGELMTGGDECQVAEIEPGILMLNARNEIPGLFMRSVFITKDLGETWEAHPTSRNALIERQCNASLIFSPAEENSLGRDILLFANCDSDESRCKMTIKASLDKGMTWNEADQVMLDEDIGSGYPSMTMVDRETVGIFYEGTVANLVFQRIKLKDLVNSKR